MFYLKPLATGQSPTALKRSDRLKQCHCLQFAQSVLLAPCITLRACTPCSRNRLPFTSACL